MFIHALRRLLVLGLCALPQLLQADALPVTFARSGQRTPLSIHRKGGKGLEKIVLRAFGHQWGEPVAVKDGIADLVPPQVRVPVAFRVTPPTESNVVLAELVVYPDVPVRWDKKDVQLAQLETPPWFNTWTAAVGLPVQRIENAKQLATGHWRLLEKPGLLIVGPKAIGGNVGAASRLAVDHSTNVLVLEDDWLRVNERSCQSVLSPKQMTGPLADMRTWHWPLLPRFSGHALRILNRQTWIAGPEYPWVEEIRSSQKGTEPFRTVMSYVPWQEQLGRTEIADTLFLRLLTETASGAKDRPALDRRWCLVYPNPKDIAASQRPVLAAAAPVLGDAESQDVRAYVVDLRGDTSISADFFKENIAVRKIEARIGPETPLLILGDNAALDGWKWLAPDRLQHRSPQPGVFWWPDHSLPSTSNQQLQLMQFFTDRDISLGDVLQE